MYRIVDFQSRKEVVPGHLVFTEEDGPWEVVMDLAAIKSKLNLDYFKQSLPCLAKYLPLMPVKDHTQFVSLKEMATPLMKSKTLGKKLGIDLYFKLESKNPTGSFKDRGSAVDVTVAKEMGAKGIALASTGNMAASCACYAAQAKLPCFVFVPEGVSMAKLAQVIAFGGHIVQVKGNYNDAAELAKAVAIEKGFYLAGDYAFRVEGAKTAAFELIDQLLFDAPDMVVVPIGCGTNIASYAKGFREYEALGLIDKQPRLLGVQAEGASPVCQSYARGDATVAAVKGINTVASAIAIGDPLDGVKALQAIYSTDGKAVAVSDREILEAQYLLSKEEGIFVESAGAAPLAALMKIAQECQGQKVVCVLTGDGLKDPTLLLKIALKPPTIYPDKKEFTALYDEGFFANKTVFFLDKNKVLFAKEPTTLEIKQKLKELFQSEYDEEYIALIKEIASSCLKKGKTVTIADFQDIVQDALEMLRNKSQKAFSVLDFTVGTGKDRMANACVKVRFNDEDKIAEAEGVGPFDAIIKALTKACEKKIDFALNDFKVDIRSQGIDAVVYVELQLQRGTSISMGRATSPDILQASVAAFEEAYNGLRNEKTPQQVQQQTHSG